MPNYAKRPIRYDQSSSPAYRVPSRDAERAWWTERKKILLPLIERGMSSRQIAEVVKVSPETVRSNFQRLYNELGLPKRQRNPASLLRNAYARGWLPCPCGRSHNSDGTTEDRG